MSKEPMDIDYYYDCHSSKKNTMKYFSDPSQRELKYLNNNYFQQDLLPGGHARCINWMPLGINIGQRIGKQVMIKHLHVHGYVEPWLIRAQLTGFVKADYIRMWILYDKQTNGQNFTILSFLDSTSENVGEPNPNFRNRWLILHEQELQLDAAQYDNATSTGTWNKTIDSFDVKLHNINLLTTYNNDNINTDERSINTGAIYVLFTARNDNIAVAGEGSVVTYRSHLKYWDS